MSGTSTSRSEQDFDATPTFESSNPRIFKRGKKAARFNRNEARQDIRKVDLIIWKQRNGLLPAGARYSDGS